MLTLTYIIPLTYLVLKINAVHILREQFAGLSVDDQFEVFIETFNKSYADEAEKAMRFKNFQESLKEIETLQKTEMGTAVYGITIFSDMSNEEFMRRYKKSYLPPEDLETDENDWELLQEFNRSDSELLTEKPPRSFSWENTQLVPPPEYEGKSCEADWIFSAVTAFEIMYSVKKNKKFTFSDQEVLDCALITTQTNRDGCKGGYPAEAFDFLKRVGVVESKYYIYEGVKNVCFAPTNHRHHKLKETFERKVKKKDSWGVGEKFLAKTILEYPVTAIVSWERLKNYAGGIVHVGSDQCSKKIDDASFSVLVLGYGYEPRKKWKKLYDYQFWKCRASLGSLWGEAGNIRFYKGDNVCGIANWLNWGTY